MFTLGQGCPQIYQKALVRAQAGVKAVVLEGQERPNNTDNVTLTRTGN